MVCAEILDPSRVSGYLTALHEPAKLPQLLQQARWPNMRSSALMQCYLGVLDPFDVEAHFAPFEAPIWQHNFWESLHA